MECIQHILTFPMYPCPLISQHDGKVCQHHLIVSHVSFLFQSYTSGSGSVIQPMTQQSVINSTPPPLLRPSIQSPMLQKPPIQSQHR